MWSEDSWQTKARFYILKFFYDPDIQLKEAANELENAWKGWNEADLNRFGASKGLE